MRKLLIISLGLLLSASLTAQYISGGSGVTFTPSVLADSAGSHFTSEGTNYILDGEIIISAGDTLLFTGLDTLFFNSTGDLRIEGTLVAQPEELIVVTASDSTLGYPGITFDESNGSVIENIEFSHGGGVKLLYSDVYIKDCSFYKMTDANGSGAVNLLQSNPVIESCNFTQNMRSAISSGATAASSPVIKYNHLYHNNTENGNRPQINLGTSDGQNNIIIRGNIIDGNYDETGGISLATLAGGEVSAVVDSNTIINNRYGINVQGTVSADITHNHIINNNLEDNPYYGGSGIAFSSGAQAFVAHNIIRGNLWGITIQSDAQPNFGEIEPDTANIGHNYIYENGNGGITYNLYNNSTSTIYAQNNYWGTTSVTEAGDWIVDQADDNTLGEVFYEPIYTLNTEKAFLYFAFELNDTTIEASIDEENKLITATLPPETDISGLSPIFTLSEYARAEVDDEMQVSGQTVQDFTDTLHYEVIAEDSTTTTYKVAVDVATSIYSDSEIAQNIFPNPFNEVLHVKSKNQVVRATILDMAGKVVQMVNTKGTQISFRSTNWSPGVYLIRLHYVDGTHVTKKVIKK
ncbi:hypothetical protein L21SP5_03312 [Salinivirga cyanobacteriivorans]|uniref:Secretion system C-terminal sorting domain-containing protein n=1 Tax=Salinivirga cyanobacteriivorans TaxID=1307839 RepID=A0A0S2I438_9BACT|nr:right-handed parallel beta-helix repeat-containing protein [Salinivirga cyanobacteriivorans]ALO16925.1 hypothetical protein L21SP5_03312 [Salinivirga cyanobacteriivorans]